MAEVERLSGKSFAVVTDIPVEDRIEWDEGQEAQFQMREQERYDIQTQIDELESQIATEEYPDNIKDLLDALIIPPQYTKKSPPQWMIDRGVTSSIRG